MKSAKEWAREHSQSGPFDCILFDSAEGLVAAIQADALLHAAELVNTMSRGTKSEDRAIAIDEARDLISDEARPLDASAANGAM